MERGKKWSRFVMRVSLLPIIMLLFSCAEPARYIVISEDMKDIGGGNADHTDQRYICLTKDDARNNAAILALHTKSDIRNYEQKRKESRNSVEDVLYHLIRGDYKKAEELLDRYGDSVPDYLRLLLKADLTYEHEENDAQDSRVVKLYQEAYEVQTSDISRNIIKLRIRQLMYGR